MSEGPREELKRIGQLLERFQEEVEVVFDDVVMPNWGDDLLHGLTNFLHGSVAICFAKMDLISLLWRGREGNQTNRMVEFIVEYMGESSHEARIAVEIWRHQLMHTAYPRPISIEQEGRTYRWLLHWGPEHLPRDQHFAYSEVRNERILGLGLEFLVEDVRNAFDSYRSNLTQSKELQSNLRIGYEIASEKRLVRIH